MLLCMLPKVVFTFLITRPSFKPPQDVCDKCKPRTLSSVIPSPDFLWETYFSVVLFGLFSISCVFFWVDLCQLLIWRKENIYGINADPLWPLTFMFLLIFNRKTDRIMVNSQLVLLKLPGKSEMHGVGSNLDWSPTSNISSCYKVGLFSLWILLWLYSDKPRCCFSSTE